MQTTMTELERSTMARVTWRLLPFLLLLYIISWLDRVNVGFAKLQMNADLGMSDTAYGFGAGIFFLGYALCEVPSNLTAGAFRRADLDRAHHDHLGTDLRRHDVRAGRLSFYVMRFLLGVAEAGFLPGIVYYLSQWFPRAQRARAVSWFMIGIPLSIVFGGPLSGWLLGFDGHLGPAWLAMDVPHRRACRRCCSASWCWDSSPKSPRTRSGSTPSSATG